MQVSCLIVSTARALRAKISTRITRHAAVTGLLATSALLAGCGGTAGVDGLAPASGTVIYQGQPVEGATVVFSPQGEGRASSGITNNEGRFQLTTLRSGDGVLPGPYQVTVSKTEVVGGGLGEEEPGASAEAQGEFPGGTVKNLLPEKYKSLESSGLTVEVTASGENDFTLNLDE